MSRKVIEYTCTRVHHEVQKLHFISILEANNYDLHATFSAIAREAAEIAQSYGASEVRNAYENHVHELEKEIGDLRYGLRRAEDERDELRQELNELKERE